MNDNNLNYPTDSEFYQKIEFLVRKQLRNGFGETSSEMRIMIGYQGHAETIEISIKFQYSIALEKSFISFFFYLHDREQNFYSLDKVSALLSNNEFIHKTFYLQYININ